MAGLLCHEAARDDDLARTIDYLQTAWSQLRPRLHYTKEMYNYQGDVFEYILNETKLTGPAIPDNLRRARLELLVIMRDIYKLLYRLDLMLYQSTDGPPTYATRVTAGEYAHFMALAMIAHNPDEAEPLRDLALRDLYRKMECSGSGSLNP